jgi:protein SCO1/2
MIRLLALFMLICAAPVCAATGLGGFAYDQRVGAHLPLAAPFRDATGRAVTLQEALAHRPTILVLGYFHCPNLCGLVRDDLMQALSRLDAPSRYSLVVLSIDPSETPADARSAQQQDADRLASVADGHYLTGSAQAVRAVTDAVGLGDRFDAADKQFLHPAGIVFLTGSGTVSCYLLGLGYQPSDVGLGLSRAAKGLTARALPILLLCFHYDAATGRYTLAIVRILQLAAVITILTVGGTVALALRRERRSR